MTTTGPDGTRGLLRFGMAAGPLYVIVGVLEVLFRPGFDLRRHALSLMSNGDWGWIQIASFVASGLLVIAGATGLRQATRPGPGSMAGPLLLGLYGLGLIGAGLFVADPMEGFPPGTPAGPPLVTSWHGPLHFVAGGLGFFGLIAGMWVFAYRFGRGRELGWAAWSFLAGLFFFGAFAAIASGTRHPAINLAFTAAVVVAWAWLTSVTGKLRSELGLGIGKPAP